MDSNSFSDFLPKTVAVLIVAAVLATASPPAWAQARPSVGELFLRDGQEMFRARLEGERAEKLAEIRRATVEAFQASQTGEVRRQLARGRALLAGEEWTPLDDYRHSLLLETDTVIADSERPVYLRLRQIYSPNYRPRNELSLRVFLAQRLGERGHFHPGNTVREFGEFFGIQPDLIDMPFRVELDCAGVEDGAYLVVGEIREEDSAIHTLRTTVHFFAGLSDRRVRARDVLRQFDAPEPARAAALYPFDLARRINLGEMPAGRVDFLAEVRHAEDVLARLERGEDPLGPSTGLLKRSYLFDPAKAILPYRVFVPSSYDHSRTYPLVMILHGLGGDESSLLLRSEGLLGRLAEQHDYIVAAPLGYDRTTGYGREFADFHPPAIARLAGQPTETLASDSAAARRNPSHRRSMQWAEDDVRAVLELVRREFRVDPNRIYLMGHSMGGTGAWHLAANFAETWGGVCVVGAGSTPLPETLERMSKLPVLLVHGEQDAIAPVETARLSASHMKELGIEHVYVEVPGGSHSGVLPVAWRRMFPFFTEHRRAR